MDYSWAWYEVSPFSVQGQRNLSFMLEGLLPTLSVSLAAFGVSIALGLVIALLGFIPWKPAKVLNRVWVELFRSIPFLVMILWVYYGLPISIGIDLNIFSAAVVALALTDSAFEAEIFRGGIQSIGKDQLETARSLGLTPGQTMVSVILPQAIRRILPPLGNQFVYMLKISSLASVIGFAELTRKANELTLIKYRPLEIYTVLILEYLALILLASWLVRRLEARLGSSHEGHG